MGKYYSPLRYPGGKAVLAEAISDIIIANNLEGSNYYEPFSGGSGVALHLLMNGFVNNIFINDADYNIFAFWHSVISENKSFINKILSVPVSIEEWHKQKEILNSYQDNSVFDIGFACFFLNRCNRSGIIKDAGPIGGIDQSGKWKIDARFNKNGLCDRISQIGAYKDKIKITNNDAIDFLKNIRHSRNKNFVYLDPPYYNKGQELYLNFYNHEAHKELSVFLKGAKYLNWTLSYDNTVEIKNMYRDFRQYEYNLSYSAQDKKRGKEIFVIPKNIYFPNINRKILFKLAS